MASSTRQTSKARLIETEAIIVAYAMSRLNTSFLEGFGYSSWRSAFAGTGDLLGVPAASMKNLRDEFDPVHGYRKGWHQRPLRPNRQRVLTEFCDVSDEALQEVVESLLRHDRNAIEQVVGPLAFAKERVENVAERLRTGRMAEEFFMSNSNMICGIDPKSLVDRRQDAVGFDFAVSGQTGIAIEVKGLKKHKGAILFTDLEWQTAQYRQRNYWLVVVGNIATTPIGQLLCNPADLLSVKSQVRRAFTVSWQATVSINSGATNESRIHFTQQG